MMENMIFVRAARYNSWRARKERFLTFKWVEIIEKERDEGGSRIVDFGTLL
jgi:hypothetical protein